jgi:hypothetical protein
MRQQQRVGLDPASDARHRPQQPIWDPHGSLAIKSNYSIVGTAAVLEIVQRRFALESQTPFISMEHPAMARRANRLMGHPALPFRQQIRKALSHEQ